jgi:hypothetical protein
MMTTTNAATADYRTATPAEVADHDRRALAARQQPDAADLLAALAAVREALDIPHAATVGDDEIPAKILDERLGHTVAMLAGILDRDPVADIPWSAGYLRERLAEHPAEGYKTWAERVAELEAAKAATA